MLQHFAQTTAFYMYRLKDMALMPRKTYSIRVQLRDIPALRKMQCDGADAIAKLESHQLELLGFLEIDQLCVFVYLCPMSFVMNHVHLAWLNRYYLLPSSLLALKNGVHQPKRLALELRI